MSLKIRQEERRADERAGGRANANSFGMRIIACFQNFH